MGHLATRITYSNLNAAVVVASGSSIIVHGILINNTTAGALDYTITDGDGSNTLAIVTVPADSQFQVIGGDPVLFDKGLRFAAKANTSHVTVFHSAVGT